MDSLLPDIPRADNPYSFSELPEDSLRAAWSALRIHTLTWHPDADLDEQLRHWALTGAGDHDYRPLWTTGNAARRADE